jgi:predicted Zn-dependent protease
MSIGRTISLTQVIGLLFLTLGGCGPDVEKMKADAQEALSVGNFSQARKLSSSALEQSPPSDKRLRWSLERIRLEALARDNQGEEAARTLERLASEYPSQATAALYLAIASYLEDAGGTAGAIEILAAGDARFPEESEKFKAAIDELQEVGLDPAEIERLKSLGYL